MQFNRIWYDGATVKLQWDEKLDGGALDQHAYIGDKPPTPFFKSSLQEFAPFVVRLLGLPDEWLDGLTVRSLSLKIEDKTGARGLQVTVLRKIADAKNRPVTITTPYLAQPPEGYQGDGRGYLTADDLELIAEAEEAAERYHGGEYGEQTSLELTDASNGNGASTSENARNFNERAAAAEIASTRKARKGGKKGPKAPAFVPGVGDVVNPGVLISPTDDELRSVLLTVDRDVPIDAIHAWTSTERDSALAWATLTQKRLTGQVKAGDVPAEPECVAKSATLPLQADEWETSPPPKLDSDALQEIAAAKEAD